MGKSAATIVPMCEMAIAVAIILPFTRDGGIILALVFLFAANTSFLFRATTLVNTWDCHCFGAQRTVSKRGLLLGRVDLDYQRLVREVVAPIIPTLRNSLLAGLAAFPLWGGTGSLVASASCVATFLTVAMIEVRQAGRAGDPAGPLVAALRPIAVRPIAATWYSGASDGHVVCMRANSDLRIRQENGVPKHAPLLALGRSNA